VFCRPLFLGVVSAATNDVDIYVASLGIVDLTVDIVCSPRICIGNTE